jgi:4'-phosphopantetheinyl transferase
LSIPAIGANVPTSKDLCVHVWGRETGALSEKAIEWLNQTLSPDEQTRRDRFRRSEDMRDFAAAHDLLRHLLTNYERIVEAHEWRFETSFFGKPLLSRSFHDGTAIEFSLSHTLGFVACAVSSRRVGIDVERVKPHLDCDQLAERYFVRDEIRMLRRLAPDTRVERFFELWTLKESLLKALGCGLSGPLEKISFHLEEGKPICVSGPEGMDMRAWRFAIFAPQPEVRMAVAVESQAPIRLCGETMGSHRRSLALLASSSGISFSDVGAAAQSRSAKSDG